MNKILKWTQHNSRSILTDNDVAVFAVFFIKRSSIFVVQFTKEQQTYLPRGNPRLNDENARFQILLDGDVDTNYSDETTACSPAVACETCQKKKTFFLSNISFMVVLASGSSSQKQGPHDHKDDGKQIQVKWSRTAHSACVENNRSNEQKKHDRAVQKTIRLMSKNNTPWACVYNLKHLFVLSFWKPQQIRDYSGL